MTAPTTKVKIWLALKARVETLPLTFAQEMPADQEFVRPSDDDGPLPYIEVRHLPNRNTRFLIGSDDPDDRRGILQLVLCYPVSRKHAYEVMSQYAGLIAAWFPKDLPLSFQGVSVRVTDTPDEAQEYREDGYDRFPVTVRYQSFA